MMRRRVFILAANSPSLALRVAHKIRRIAQRDPVILREPLRPLSDEHHVRAVLQHGARQPDRIPHALQSSDSSSAQGRAVHHNRVAFHPAVEIQMRPESRVKHRFVFELHDSGFDSVQRRSPTGKHGPACFESSAATRIAGLHRLVGNIPSPAMHNQRRFHRDEDCNATKVCPERGKVIVFIP